MKWKVQPWKLSFWLHYRVPALHCHASTFSGRSFQVTFSSCCTLNTFPVSLSKTWQTYQPSACRFSVDAYQPWYTFTDTKSTITHGDIKLENILVQYQDVGGIYVKLADFGLTRASRDLTTIRGSPRYLAPKLYNES
jgi:serine/threonine protein kinase